MAPTIPYLYLEEGTTLAELSTLLQQYQLEAVPKERYYYHYRDALRIIDFVQTKGIYDGWVLLIKEQDIPKAEQLLAAHPDKFQPYAMVEKEFLEGLSNILLQQTLGSQHAVGNRLELIKLLLEERGIPTTEEDIAQAKELVQLRNEEQQPSVQYAKVLIWTGVALAALGYLWLMGLFR